MLKKYTTELTSSTLVCCIHHCRSPLFEEGMNKLVSVGLDQIWILDTGTLPTEISMWGEYQGPYKRHIELGIQNVFKGMIELRKLSIPEHIERIVLIDNDCFIFDPTDTLDYIQAFVEHKYDHVSLSSFHYPRSNDVGDIIIPADLKKITNENKLEKNFKIDELGPGSIAYSIFSKDFWHSIKSLKKGKMSETSLAWWSELAKLNPKFGLHQMNQTQTNSKHPIREYLNKYRPGSYSQFEENKWLHLGNLMISYFKISTGKEEELSQLDKGYFCKYFPSRVNFSPDDRKKYIEIWNNFLIVAGAQGK